MAKFKKLLRKLDGATDARFQEVEALLLHVGYRHVNTVGDHFVYSKREGEYVTVIADKGRTVRKQYIKRVLAIVERELALEDDSNTGEE